MHLSNFNFLTLSYFLGIVLYARFWYKVIFYNQPNLLFPVKINKLEDDKIIIVKLCNFCLANIRRILYYSSISLMLIVSKLFHRIRSELFKIWEREVKNRRHLR